MGGPIPPGCCGITRRGLLVGAGLVAAPFVIRSRPASVAPIALPADRTYPRGDLLISPKDLYQRIIVDRLPTRILDATDLATYRDRHIPGALHVWWQDTMELNATYYGMVLKPDVLSDAISAWGTAPVASTVQRARTSCTVASDRRSRAPATRPSSTSGASNRAGASHAAPALSAARWMM